MMNSIIHRQSQRGLTLLEVIVAISILALMAVITSTAIDAASQASERSDRKMKEIRQLDRAWLLLESDLRNTLAYTRKPPLGDVIPPLRVSSSAGEYWLVLLRGGRTNPLNLPRTEIERVAYILQDDVLMRYSWTDASNMDEDLAKKQKILSGVDSVLTRVLEPTANNFSRGPWSESWPKSSQQSTGAAAVPIMTLPLALEITITLKNEIELKRLFSLVEGQ